MADRRCRAKCGTPMLNYALAEQYSQELETVASIVIRGKLASLVTSPAILAFLLR